MANQSTPVIQIKDSNVGIGTNSPIYKLNVIGDISFPSRNTAGTYRIGMGREDGSGWAYAQNIAFISDGGGGYITFSTQEPGVGGGEYMRLNYTGNLLIGTTTDSGYKLRVNGTAMIDSSLRLVGNMTVGGDTSQWSLAGVANGGAIWQKSNSGAGGSDDRYLRLGNVDNNGTPNYVLTIFNSNVGINTTNPGNQLQIGSMGSTGYAGNHLTIGDGTSVFAVYMASNLTNLYTNKAFSFQASGSGATGNVLINTTTDAGYKLNVNGDVYTSSNYGLNAVGDYAARYRTYAPADGNWGLLTYAADPEYHMVITGASSGDSGANRQFRVYDRPTGNTRFVVNFSNGYTGIGTTAPNRSLQVVGTTRHERVYAYANNTFQFTNDVPTNVLWLHLGTQSSFKTDKIYYRVNTNTSEEEGEIIVSNTCVEPLIEWHRNSYNVMVTAVKARMTSVCGSCEIWIQVRYGSNYGGTYTTVQWQVYNGTDDNFVTVNATGTPGTGTNEKNLTNTDGYFYETSGNIKAPRYSNAGFLGTGQNNARNHFTPLGAGSASPATGWIAAAFGDALADRIVIGQWTNGAQQAIFGAHTANLDDWADTNYVSKNHKFYYNGDWSITPALTINTSGNVLIGTTTDNGNKLRVQGTTWISGNVYTNGEQGVELAWTGNTINDNRIGRIRPISTSSQNPYAGGLAFDYYKYDGAAYTFFEGMRLNGSGNLGIGTAAPEQKLHVQGSGLMATLQNSSTAADGYTQLEFKAGDRYGYIWLGNQNTTSWAGAGGLNIYTSNGNMDLWTGGAQRIRIMNAGNVLIGTTTDAGYKLDVFGKTRVYTGAASGATSPDADTALLIDSAGNQYIELRTSSASSGIMQGILFTDNGQNAFIGFKEYTGQTPGTYGEAIHLAYYDYSATDPNNGIYFGTSNTPSDGVSNVQMFIKGNGNVGIGTSSPSYKLDITGDARVNSGALGVNVAPSATDGRIDASNDIVAYSSSDLRLKENIKPIENALDKVKSLTGVEFDWKAEHKKAHGYEGHDTGIIAQEVQEVMPTAVRTNDTGYLAVRYEKLIGLLIEAVKEQQAEIEELKKLIK